MKIFEVVAIKETLDIKKVGDVWRIIQTDTGEFASEIVYRSAGEAEVARDTMRANMRDVLSRDGQVRASGSGSDFSAGVRPGTPTMGQLSDAQQRRLSRTGKIRHKGRQYTRAQINAATELAARLATVQSPDLRAEPRNTTTTTPTDTPDTDAKPKQGIIDKVKKIIKDWFLNSKVGKILARFFTGALATKIITLFNIAALEDALDGYVRAIADHGATLDTQEKKLAFIEQMKAGDIPPRVADAYLACVEKVARIITEAAAAGIATFLTFKTAGAALAGLAGFIGTGPIGWIVAIIAGGALIWGGTELIAEILDAVGLADLLEDQIAPVLSPRTMFNVARIADGIQEMVGIALDTGDSIPVVSLVVPDGDVVRDSVNNNAPKQLKERKSTSEIRSNLQQMMQDNPKLRQAFEKGKDKGKEAVAQLTSEEA